MKKFLELGNRYASESDWKDFALTKFCLCAMGIIIGACMPKKCKKKAIQTAGIVFLGTYVPLMMKVYRIYKDMSEQTSEIEE